MKPRSRSLLILSTTLLVGMLLGALVHARFFEKRVKRMHRLSTPEGFVESYVRTIEPSSPEQEQAVREVVAVVAGEVVESIRANREENGRRMDAMVEQLEPLLDEVQKQRLQERRDKYRRR
ncbi:hypothetical protein [Pelagicoccus sp. SDUM812005]|uniref:hypothetical protein n=1 Tax=Pelagicoccus sp. SDUM812005 TaxID=3041257 RepID=UPI00280C7991|nr:hypothetical protein [Pelagicoccus sp. SDUM812005]MDQ8181271.1 hypothetical protein [Pelagicoccus sp. SDUM812005]